jgi:hypothetical protein
MYIYGCINRESHFSHLSVRGVAESFIVSTACGNTGDTFAIAFPRRESCEKIARIAVTPNSTVPCVEMHIIHFARAVMHQNTLLRSLRGRGKSSRERRSDRWILPKSNLIRDRRRSGTGGFERTCMFVKLGKLCRLCGPTTVTGRFFGIIGTHGSSGFATVADE